MTLQHRSSRFRRATVAGLGPVLVAGLLGVGAPVSSAADDVVMEAPAVMETRPSDAASDTMDDPAIWADPTGATQPVIFGADHKDLSLNVYDLAGERLQKLPLDHGNNVDVRPGFTMGGQKVGIVGLAGHGEVSFYKYDPLARQLSNVTPGGATIDRAGLEKPGDGPFYAHGMCLYNSPVSGDFFAFVVDRFGHVKQLKITDGGNGKIAFDEVRHINVEPRPAVGNPDQTEACVVDEESRSFFLAEQDWNIWRYGAEPTDPAGTGDRAMVDKEVSEGGHFTREAEGLAVVNVPGGASYLIASSQKANQFTVYRGTAPYDFVRQVKVVGSGAVDGCENTDGIDAVYANLGPDFAQGIFVCQDNENDGNMNFKAVRLEDMVPMAAAPVSPSETPDEPGPRQAAPSSGYWMLGSAGKVFPFGDAKSYGDAPAARPLAAVDLEPTPSGNGYWVIDSRGTVQPRGDAVHHGALPGGELKPGENVTSLSSTRRGGGYWVFTSLGRVFAFGDAKHLGDMAGTRLNAPVLDSITTPTGAGYYMVAADGGIFSFGDAAFFGSMGATRLNQPVQSLVPDPDGAGYWLVASDGGVFAFAAPFRGSMAATPLNKPVTGMVAFGNGYLMVGADGGIFNFSDKAFHGSLGATPPADPITAVAVLG